MSMVAKLGRVVIYNEEFPLIKYMILQLRGFVTSRDNSNALYFHLHQTNGHQIWQGGDLSWGAFTHKVT